MSDASDEIPLSGGRTTSGVVRLGNTVRRPPRLNAEFIRALLNHLAAVGFVGSPRFLGVDEKGREILSFIEGEVPTELGRYEDATLQAGAGLIRDYHNATVGLLSSKPVGSPRFEVVCHNDLSPCNFVFSGGVPIAFIDFDAAAPGTRRMDVAYAAWLWLDLGNVEITAAEQRRRLRLFLNAYDPALDVAPVKRAILDRQEMLAEEGEFTGRSGTAQWARVCRAWTVQNL
jgi:aminoglycoside phosphotransferase (APT) family kinase protein